MSSRLVAHPFLAEVFERAKPVILAGSEYVRQNMHREEEAKAENRARMKPSAQYDTLVIRRCTGLVNTLGVPDDARRLIGMFPTSVGRGANAVTRDRWVDYHYGYFTVSLASLPDIAIVMASAVYQLGLPPRHCTADIVGSHDRIKNSPVGLALREIGKAVRLVKERRNPHIHRGDHVTVADLAPDRFLRDLRTITFAQSVDPSIADSETMAAGWRLAHKTIAPVLDKEVADVEAPTSKFLDALLPIFVKQSDIYRTLEADAPTA